MEKIKMGFMGVGTFLSYMVGGFDMLIEILLIMITLDYVTGILKGIILKKISSSVGYVGIARKGLIFVIIILAVQVDRLFNSDLARTCTIWYYIGNEGISIIENVGQMGINIPNKIKNILIQIQNKGEEGEKKND